MSEVSELSPGAAGCNVVGHPQNYVHDCGEWDAVLRSRGIQVPMDGAPRTLPKEAVFAFCRRPPDWQATTMREVFGMDVPWPGNVKDMMRHLRETNQRQAFIDYMASQAPEDPE